MTAALNLTQLSPSLFLSRPSVKDDIPDSTAPKLIFLATWMNARDVHIAKYIIRYQTLYPTAHILVATSSFRYYFSPRSARREVAPAVKVIRDVLGDDTSKGSEPRMLIHVFSNGGSCVLYHLYDRYAKASRERSSTSEHERLLPSHVTIFDSVPGRWSYKGSTQAVLAAVPAGWARKLAIPPVHILGSCWVVKYILLRVPEETHVWGGAHNDPARVRETCRAYVYSETDQFVQYRAVEKHADDAETKGFVVVRRDKFPNSAHVAHARSNPDRYWSLVKETWEAGQRQDEKLPANL
ncbi:uncharacterized protein LY89DRAFT_588758 [Mollisia scopiformis]|uniref:Uncharacterized protein n=1 Tax=Mollisia scopiformis TaxID=149040 RepID=A0A194X4I0_MOLSC|nr:uncharacterized protein LY89DRAFT_588758 [Mollisia scopiformis]KUJ15088.1 hypothetical protein LY89DRAFT_588758 [Mollisia scopiformis]